ncbi:serpin family protein [Paenibacillus koleovorans]|uniref:serpin family protein n=1 Tax=Paenibacillus koleovorans TaxID=121608 RepID=UPI000FD710CD|nr:serpin family protein [Paenibacillus koleovorans]
MRVISRTGMETGARVRTSHSLWKTGLAGLLIAAVVGGCGIVPGQNGKDKKSQARYAAADVDRQLVQGYNAFGFELLGKLEENGKQGNVFISPSSAAFALSMLMNGAVGSTRDEIAKLLHVQDRSADEANRGADILRDVLLHADDKVEVSVANSLWARKGIVFHDAFLKTNLDYYKARTTVLDFASPKAADTINLWVSDETRGKIKTIVDNPINSDTIMFLINAVYFKGSWTTPFQAAATMEKPFRLEDAKEKQAPFMRRGGSYLYAKQDGYQAVRLPYGGGNYGMVLLLPDEGVGPAALGKKLAGGEWERMKAALQSKPGEVLLPRFKLEYEAGLNDALQALGMQKAFKEGQAEFGAMAQPPVEAFVSKVKQKTYLNVDETGSEAAAVTVIELLAGSAQVNPDAPFRMELNRPFLVAIEERTTGTVLFVGAVYDPVGP